MLEASGQITTIKTPDTEKSYAHQCAGFGRHPNEWGAFLDIIGNYKK